MQATLPPFYQPTGRLNNSLVVSVSLLGYQLSLLQPASSYLLRGFVVAAVTATHGVLGESWAFGQDPPDLSTVSTPFAGGTQNRLTSLKTKT